MNPEILVPVALFMLGAGVLKGCIGFGAPLVAVPIVSMLIGPRPAIILMSVPLTVTNAVILFGQPHERSGAGKYLPILITLVPATFVGGLLLSNVNTGALAIVVGVVSIAFAIISWIGVSLRPPDPIDRPVAAAVGIVAGLLNGSTSIPGPLFAMYLSTQGLEKRAFVFAITLLLIVGNVSQVASYAQIGLYAGGLFVASAAMAPVLLLGQQLGARVQRRLQSRLFARLVLIAVAISGVNLILHSLTA